MLFSGVDVEAARGEEERVMEEDAQSWLNKGQIPDDKDPKTGTYSLAIVFLMFYLDIHYHSIWKITRRYWTGKDKNLEASSHSLV